MPLPPILSLTGCAPPALGDLGPYSKPVVKFHPQTKTVTRRWLDENKVSGPVNIIMRR